MFVKNLLVLTLGALAVSASPIKPQDGTSEAALRERSLVPDFMSFDKRDVAYAVKRSPFADFPNSNEGSLEKRAPKTAKQRAAARRKALAKKKAARVAAQKAAAKKAKQAAAAAKKQAAAAAAAPAPARVAAPAAVVAAAAPAAVVAAADQQETPAPAQSPAAAAAEAPASDRAALIAAVRAAAAAARGNPPSGANRPTRPSTTCTSDGSCTVGTNIEVLGPAPRDNSAPRCNFGTRTCYYGCADGYALVGDVCVQNQPVCGAETCGTIENGVYTCGQDNTCQLQCETAGGYDAFNGECINPLSDARRCGPTVAQGVECQVGYNNKGDAVCRQGVCGISCFGGTLRSLNGALYCQRAGST